MIDENFMIICHVVRDGSKIKNEWDRIFTYSIDEDVKKNIYFDQYRWHVFSFDIIEAIEGDAARECFNRSLKEKIYESYRDKDKNKLFAFYQDEYEVYEIEIDEHLEASCFDMERDIYIFDPENRWTYINTHERDWLGPYYYRI